MILDIAWVTLTANWSANLVAIKAANASIWLSAEVVGAGGVRALSISDTAARLGIGVASPLALLAPLLTRLAVNICRKRGEGCKRGERGKKNKDNDRQQRT